MADEVLDRSIGILIPSKTVLGEELTEEAIQGAIEFVRDAFVDIFSALTDDGARTVFQKSQLQGCYTARNGVRIDEPLVLIYAYYPSSEHAGVVQHVTALAQKLRLRMNQECVAIVEFGATSMSFV